MNLYRLIAQLDDRRSPLCIVQDDAGRQQTYQTILCALISAIRSLFAPIIRQPLR
jgi:hypothetical protein